MRTIENPVHKKDLPALLCFEFVNYWKQVSSFPSRTLDTVFATEDIVPRLRNTIKTFKSSKQKYSSIGTPWTLTILLHGPPGNGKTTLVRAIASEWNRSLFILRLRALSVQHFAYTIRTIPAESVVIIDDLDHILKEIGEESKHMPTIRVTDLMSILDGSLSSSEGTIFVLTANSLDTIPPELIREGRVDTRIAMNPPTQSVAADFVRYLVQRWNGNDKDDESTHRDVETLAHHFALRGASMSDIQQCMFRAEMDVTRAILDVSNDESYSFRNSPNAASAATSSSLK